MVHVEIAAEQLFTIGPLIVTNSMIGALLASVVLLVIARFFASGSAIVPSRGQSLVELPIEFLAGIVRGTGGKRWRQFAPLIFAIFLFVLTANWMSLLPGVGTIGLAKEASDGTKIIVPFVRAGAADLNFTLGLALISFVSFIAFGLRANGARGYLKELLIAEPAYMTPLLTPIHLISELSRVISLSMRLFGNVFAGEVLLATMLALTTATVFMLPLAFVIPGVFIGLELLFGLVQALVFALLSMTYITLAIAEHRQHGDADHHSGGDPSKVPPRRTGRRKQPQGGRPLVDLHTLAAGLAMGLGGIGPGIGLGIGFSKAMEAIGRNPEASGTIFVPYILGLALTEAIGIYALVVSLIILFAS